MTFVLITDDNPPT